MSFKTLNYLMWFVYKSVYKSVIVDRTEAVILTNCLMCSKLKHLSSNE